MKPAIAYTRVSTSEQGRSGLGLEAREAIHDFARRESFEISEIFQDIETGKGNDPLAKRPGLEQALKRAKKLKSPIIVSKLDRLSRDVEFIAGLLSRGGQDAMDAAGILPHFQGCAVHDHWKPYGRYDPLEHALCNAHHRRELRYFEESTGHFWPVALRRVLLDGNYAVTRA